MFFNIFLNSETVIDWNKTDEQNGIIKPINKNKYIHKPKNQCHKEGTNGNHFSISIHILLWLFFEACLNVHIHKILYTYIEQCGQFEWQRKSHCLFFGSWNLVSMWIVCFLSTELNWNKIFKQFQQQWQLR